MPGLVQGLLPTLAPPHMNDKSGKLRFAALRRVSTEQQEKKGESLTVQKKGIEKAVNHRKGTIVAWYGGQEHATPGHEKKEVARLIEDAKKGRFDAVIVSDADRWSRDNSFSRAGLEVFKSHRIRFFVGPQEFDLFRPMDKLILGMSAEIGEFFAGIQNVKSIDSRIERARRGLPTGGKLPFGRTWDKKTEEWGVNEEKKAIIKDCARRYLAGESIPVLAAEYRMNISNLHKILTKVSGTEWQIRFRAPQWDIDEIVTIKIPRLLADETIAKIRKRVAENKTYYHGNIKHHYLLANFVFCAGCGYVLCGQANHNDHQYYRHTHVKRDRKCRGPAHKCWIRADKLDDAVMRHLFETFGNAAAIAKAIQDATPDDERIQEAFRRQEQLTRDLKMLEASRQRLLKLVVDGKVTDAQADTQLTRLNGREQKMKIEQSQLQDELAHLPDKETIKAVAKRTASRFKYTNARKVARMRLANNDFSGMPYEDKRQLVQAVFSGKTADGRKMGVWLTWDEDGKRWRFRIEGHLIDVEGPINKDWFVFGAPEHQQDLVSSMKSALG